MYSGEALKSGEQGAATIMYSGEGFKSGEQLVGLAAAGDVSTQHGVVVKQSSQSGEYSSGTPGEHGYSVTEVQMGRTVYATGSTTKTRSVAENPSMWTQKPFMFRMLRKVPV